MDLNKPEEQIMGYLWQLERAYLKDLVEAFPEPKPAYTTVATVVSRMLKKGYIAFEQHGANRQYYPVIQKSDYFSTHLRGMIRTFFNDSAAQFGSFFTKKTALSVEELQALRELIDQEIAAKTKSS